MIAAIHLLYAATATQIFPCGNKSLLLDAATLVQAEGNLVTCFNLQGEVVAKANFGKDDLQLARITGHVYIIQEGNDFVRQVELKEGKINLLEEKPVEFRSKNLLTLEQLSSNTSLEFGSKEPFLKSTDSRHWIDFYTSDKVGIVNVSEVIYEAGTRYVSRKIYRLELGKAVPMTKGLKRCSIALFVDDHHIVGATSDENDSNLPLMSESGGTFPDWVPFVMDARSGAVQLFPTKKLGKPMTAMLPVAVNPGRTKILVKQYVMQPDWSRAEELVTVDQSGCSAFENIQFEGQSFKPVRVMDALNSTVIVLARTAHGQERTFIFRFE